MSCQITYNTEGKLEVKAPNGKDSILFQKINNLPEIDGENQALDSFLKVYTKTFKDWYGTNWENMSKKELDNLIKLGYLDANGEPAIFYRGDVEGLNSFNYSPSIGKFGQGLYIAQNIRQAEAFSGETGKEVYPVFLKPTQSKTFENKNEFLRAVSEFHKTDKIPNETQVAAYVAAQHLDDITIVGKGILGKEYNTSKKDNVKSIFTEGLMPKPLFYSSMLGQAETKMTEEFQKKRKSDKIVETLIQKLQNNLGMNPEDVQYITETEAQLLTKDLKNPWSGQAAFSLNNKIYFVKDQISYGTAIHEFSHPLVEAIANTNPKLFNKIFDDITSTNLGNTFMNESIAEYPELDKNHDQIKKETLVKAMTYVSENKDNKDIVTKIKDAVNKIIYALKQIFRKGIDNPINVKDLSVDTTVEELAQMLVDKTWNIDMSIISDKDIASYIASEKEMRDELNEDFISGTSVASGFNIIDQNITELRSLIYEAQRSEDYDTIKMVLSNPLGELMLEDIKNSMNNFNQKRRTEKKYKQVKKLKGAQTEQEKQDIEVYNKLEELEDIKERNRILAQSLIQMDAIAKKTRKHLNTLANSPDQKEAFRELKFYNRLLAGQKRQIKGMTEILMNNGLKEGSTIRDQLATIEATITDAQKTATNIIETAVSEILSEKYNQYYADSIEKADARIALLEKAKEKNPRRKVYYEGRIKSEKLKRENLKMAPETMRKFLTGQMGDIGFISSQFENFISSQDAAISTLAGYIKETTYSVDAKTQQGMNELLTKIKPITDKLGIKPDQLDKFSEQLLFEDKITRKNSDTGKLEDYKVYTFLNEHKNYKHTLAVLQEVIDEAKQEHENNPTDETFTKVAELNDLKYEHQKLFLRNENVDEYYHADEELLSTPLGREAKEEATEAYKLFQQYQTIYDDSNVDAVEASNTAAQKLADYKKLFSLRDDYGKKKTGDDLIKAQLLIKNRKDKAKYHKYTPIANAFQTSLKGEEAKINARLENEGLEPDTKEYDVEFAKQRELWLSRNTHYKNKDEFYTVRANIFDRIKEIVSTVQTTDPFAVQKEALLESLQGRKDDEGQPLALEMTSEMLEQIKNLEQEIQDAKESGDIQSAAKLLDPALRKELFAQYALLEKLQQKVPTTYYLDILDNYYQKFQREDDTLDPIDIDETNVYMFSDPEFVYKLKEKDEEFAEWFDQNHILKTNIYEEGSDKIYVRTRAWSTIKPKNEKKYSEKTDIFDDSGKIVETIYATPNMNFFKREVKDRYKTGYDPSTGVVDPYAHFDIQGYQLPKSLEDMEVVSTKYKNELAEHNQKLEKVIGTSIPWDYYINREFNQVKAEGGPRYELLQALKEFHHKTQDGLDRRKSLGFELPRERKDKYQYITSGEAKGDVVAKLHSIAKGAASVFGKRADDFDRDLNYEEQDVVIGAEAYQMEDGTKIPIRGKYNLDFNQVSNDVLNSLFTYYYSAEENKALKEIQPVAEAVRKLAENKPVDLQEQKKGVISSIANPLAKSIGLSSNNRKATIDGMIEVLFEGKGLNETWNNQAGLVKVNNVALGIAAHSFFALDIVSALKNHFGAQFQIGLEAIGGKYYNYKAYYQGRPWALNAMRKVSQEIYSETAKSLEVQMIDQFDAIQGRNKEKFGESPSRSLGRDTLNMTWMMSTRKWLESQATLQIFSAIMHYTKVNQTLNGETKEISYINAFEIDPKTKTMTLKPGIDSKWAQNGTEFNNVKMKVHEVSGHLQGLYAQEEQGIINRNLGYRSLGALKKYFYKMFMHRFAASGVSIQDMNTLLNPQERVNLATGTSHLGFYWQNILTLKEIIKSGGVHSMYMTEDEKRGLLMGAFELLKAYALYMAKVLLFMSFGTDPDDKERWSKIKKQAGALPSPLTNEKYSKDFTMSGWTRAHLLLLVMNIEAEATHFIPAPTMGLKDMYDVMTFSNSIAMTASYEALIDMMGTMYYTITGDEKVDYKKDAGALKVKEKGTNKLWFKALKMGGINGKLADPVTSGKNLEGARNR